MRGLFGLCIYTAKLHMQGIAGLLVTATVCWQAVLAAPVIESATVELPQATAVSSETCSGQHSQCQSSQINHLSVSRDLHEEGNNENTAASWDVFAPHREIVTTLLIEAQASRSKKKRKKRRLCILGAGNSNDVDLRRLLRSFGRIDLLDIDGRALERGIQRQLANSNKLRQRVFLHSGIDALGIPEEVNYNSVIGLLSDGRVAANLSAITGQSCDVVAGACIVSQLVIALGRRLENAGDFDLQREWTTMEEKVVPALLQQYVDTLTGMARPGGRSEILHVADLAPREDGRARGSFGMEEVITHHIKAGNYFMGMNPGFFLKEHLSANLSTGVLLKPEKAAGNPFWSWCPSPEAATACLVVYAVQYNVS